MFTPFKNEQLRIERGFTDETNHGRKKLSPTMSSPPAPFANLWTCSRELLQIYPRNSRGNAKCHLTVHAGAHFRIVLVNFRGVQSLREQITRRALPGITKTRESFVGFIGGHKQWANKQREPEEAYYWRRNYHVIVPICRWKFLPGKSAREKWHNARALMDASHVGSHSRLP